MSQQETIEDLAQAYKALSGDDQQITAKMRDLVAALIKGEQNIIVELPWGETVDGESYEVNQILVHAIEGKEVYFSNPLKRGDESPGMVIEGSGPRRTVQHNGVQSMELELFRSLFADGGKAMLAA